MFIELSLEALVANMCQIFGEFLRLRESFAAMVVLLHFDPEIDLFLISVKEYKQVAIVSELHLLDISILVFHILQI